MVRNLLHVVIGVGLFGHGHFGAVVQQTIHHQGGEETHRIRPDAARLERIDVQRPEFQVFHAPLPQAPARFLIALRDALGADRAVVFVFDLQLVGVQLQVFSIIASDSDFLVLRDTA